MRVALVSGSGFLGGAIARRLLAHGETPLVVHRGRSSGALPQGVVIEHGDRMDRARLDAIFKTYRPEVVIDILALSTENSRDVIAATAAIGARYILTSSIDVYANYGGLLRREQPVPLPTPATEDAPLRQMRYPYRGNSQRPKGVDDDLLDNYDKLVLEELVRADTSLRATIIRPPMIFGPGDKQHRFGWAIAAAQAAHNGNPIRLDRRAAGWLNSYGYIDDIAEAFVLAALKPEAAGRTYNVGQLQVRNAENWLALILRIMGLNVEIELADAGAGGLLAERADTMDLRYPLTLDARRIREELGFKEIISEDEALRLTIEDELAQR